MTKQKTIFRWVLGGLLAVLGLMGTLDMFMNGYDPENEGILLFGDTFRNLHNAIMLSYLGVVIRIGHIIIGILLFTKKYWWIGLLMHLPIAFNIFCIHVFHDLPFSNPFFFGMGMTVSLLTFLLVLMEKEKLSMLIIQRD